MNKTPVLDLNLPENSDRASIEDLNSNFSTIDEAIGDTYTKAQTTLLLSAKQDALTEAQLAAVNSGIDSTKVEQIATNENALAEVIDSGAKNRLNYSEIGTNSSHGAIYVSNGVTFTLNSDFSITAERTETTTVDSSCNLRIASSSLYIDDLCNENYILSGCPEGGGDTTYSLRAIRDEYRPTDTGNGVELPDRGANTNIYINMLVAATFEGSITFRPMICTKAAWAASHAYAPHRPSYQELYEMVLALQGGN